MKRSILFCCGLLALLSISSCKSDPLVGEWRVMKPGGKFPQAYKYVFNGNNAVEIDSRNGAAAVDYTLNNDVNPKQIKIGFFNDLEEGIYKIEGDKLTIKLAEDKRFKLPTDFNEEPGYVVLALEKGTSSANSMTDNTNAVMPKASGNTSNTTFVGETTNSSQNPAGVVSSEQKAIEAVRNYVEARFSKCRDSYIAENGPIYQYKNPSFVLTRTKPVTQADKLNGIEWSGEVNLTYSAVRQFDAGRWYPWENYQQFVDLTFDVWKTGSVFRVKSHQEIRFNNYDKVPCSKVPD